MISEQYVCFWISSIKVHSRIPTLFSTKLAYPEVRIWWLNPPESEGTILVILIAYSVGGQIK
jgi:hypothetical protein